jgi:multidrug efflux pump subunit AcrA (membrane-fusion protein)
VIGVPEQLMANLNPAALQKTEVRFSTDPKRLFAARWLDYEGEASRDTQTYDVRFALMETPPWSVLPGMTTTVLLSLTATDQAAIQVPMSALQSDARGDFFVWVVDPNSTTVVQRPIKLGIPGREHVPVLAGLKIGEQVVAAGGAWLSAGMKVRPLAED